MKMNFSGPFSWYSDMPKVSFGVKLRLVSFRVFYLLVAIEPVKLFRLATRSSRGLVLNTQPTINIPMLSQESILIENLRES